MAGEQKKRWYPGLGTDSGGFDSNPVPTGNMPSNPLAEQRDREIAQAEAMRDERLATSRSDAERMRIAQNHKAYVNAANQNYRIGKARQAKGQLNNEDGDYSVANAAAQTEQQQAVAQGGNQPATTAQQPATGPGLLPFQSKATTAQEGAEWTVANQGRDGQSPIETATVGNTQYWRTDGGAASKVLNQQTNQARGLPTAEQLAEYRNQQAAMRRYGNILRPNGESDRDFNANSQVVITPGRGRATNNPGYTFVGGAGDAARFFQPVGRPGGYNPYKQRFRTLFDEQMDARRAARAQPEKPQMDMTLPGNSRRAKYHEQMQAYNNELNQGYGLDAKQMENALQRQRLVQEYGLGLGQLANSNAQTQAALGLNGLQQMQTIQQLAQTAQVNAARQKLANSRPGSKDYLDAYKTLQALEGNFGKQEQDKMSDVVTINNPVGESYQVQNVRDENGNVYQRRVTEQGGDDAALNFAGNQREQLVARVKQDKKLAKEYDQAVQLGMGDAWLQQLARNRAAAAAR